MEMDQCYQGAGWRALVFLDSVTVSLWEAILRWILVLPSAEDVIHHILKVRDLSISGVGRRAPGIMIEMDQCYQGSGWRVLGFSNCNIQPD